MDMIHTNSHQTRQLQYPLLPGVKEDLFVKDLTGGYYLGQVWPGPTYFPDFFHPATQSYWTDQMKSFLGLAKVDGIWIDMNEVSEEYIWRKSVLIVSCIY
jgi:alpha-glucosidase (family GH31 glycosyl hydrolase)